MAISRLNPMFSSVSGALTKINKKSPHAGDQKMLLCTHRTAATTNNNCNRMYIRKKVERSTPVTADEILQRQRFASVSRAVATRAKDLAKMGPDKAAFQEQKNEPGGLKTMKSYLWSLEMATYDQAHQG